MTNAYNLIVMGDINLDWVSQRSLSFAFAELVTNGVIEWSPIEELPGGSGLNFAHFGCEEGFTPLLLGKVGQDAAGDFICDWLEPYHLTPGVLRSTSSSTGKAFIVRDKNDIRFLINNEPNANHDLSPADVEKFAPDIRTAGLLYISGYCTMHPDAPRRLAVEKAIELFRQTPGGQIIYDVVPHRVYKTYTFSEFLQITRQIDILISEVSTMRRFLELGNKDETITDAEAQVTAEKLAGFYPNFILRFGPSGCDRQVVWNVKTCRLIWEDTNHRQAADKRGFGDRIAFKTLKEYFGLFPQPGK